MAVRFVHFTGNTSLNSSKVSEWDLFCPSRAGQEDKLGHSGQSWPGQQQWHVLERTVYWTNHIFRINIPLWSSCTGSLEPWTYTKAISMAASNTGIAAEMLESSAQDRIGCVLWPKYQLWRQPMGQRTSPASVRATVCFPAPTVAKCCASKLVLPVTHGLSPMKTAQLTALNLMINQW